MKGIAIETIGYLVIAIIAAAFLFIFFSRLVPHIGSFAQDVMQGFRSFICDQLGWKRYLTPFCW